MVQVPVVVTGVGPVSAIGCGRNAFWDGLCAGKHGFGTITLCDATASPSKIAAEVKNFNLGDYVDGGTAMGRRTPRPAQLALAASVMALHDAELDLDRCDPTRLGVHIGTSIGNLETLFVFRDRIRDTGSLPAHAAFHAFNHSIACVVTSFFNIRGPIHTTTSGCNSGIDAAGQAMRMIQSGAVDAMLVVGTDCELVPEILAALNASGSLATSFNDDPGRASRPFDRHREGNVIGEGAAALLLEAAPHAKERRARVYAQLAGYQVCSAGQNRQYSASSPELDLRPCVDAFRGAIAEAGWQPGDVDVVNANGSSSVIYDRVEALALGEVFGASISDIPIHSIKSMLGQHGAGSSALQAVCTCLALRRGIVPGTINHDELDPECGPVAVLTETKQLDPARAIVHSIGLGGFYYSVAAFSVPPSDESAVTGELTVRWSAGATSRFKPAEDFQKPLTPWKPRRDDIS